MTWFNEGEIEDHLRFHPVDERPNLNAGARTLHNLMVWVNGHGDGWPYWQPPSKAATRLMDLLQAHNPRRVYDGLEDCTLAELKATYTPIKSFRTKANRGDGTWGIRTFGTCDFKIVDPAEAAKQAIEDAKDAIGTHVRYTIILERPIDHEDERVTDGLGVAAARFLHHTLRECGLPGEYAVVSRRIEGRNRMPLDELGVDSPIAGVNFQDNLT